MKQMMPISTESFAAELSALSKKRRYSDSYFANAPKRVRSDPLKEKFQEQVDDWLLVQGSNIEPIIESTFGDYMRALETNDAFQIQMFRYAQQKQLTDELLENKLIVETEAPRFLDLQLKDAQFRIVVKHQLEKFGPKNIDSDLQLIAKDLDTWFEIFQLDFLPHEDLEMLLQRPTPSSRFILAKAARQYRDIIQAAYEISVPVVSWQHYLQIQNQSEKFESNMTETEINTVKLQTSLSKQDSYKINRYLRTGQLETWASSVSIPQAISRIDALLTDPELPRFDFPVFVQRGVDDPKVDFLNDPGYKSTSLNPTISLKFCAQQCVLLQILLEPGFPIFQVPQRATHQAEFEVLLSRGTRFQLLSGGFTIFRGGKTLQVIRVRAVL